MKSKTRQFSVPGLILAIGLTGCSKSTPSVVYDPSMGNKPFPAVIEPKNTVKKADVFPAVGKTPKK